MVRDLDDIFGGSETVEGLADLMEKFLSQCQSQGVYLNPSKFHIALELESVKFAGIKVSSGGYEIDPARLEAIRDFERQRTNNQLQRWLDLCMSLEEFASCPLKDQLLLKRELLRKDYSGDLPWNQEKVQSSRQPVAFCQTHCSCCSPSIKLWH